MTDLGGYLKNLWIISRDYEPPFGHAEQVGLKTFTKKNVNPMDVLKVILVENYKLP